MRFAPIHHGQPSVVGIGGARRPAPNRGCEGFFQQGGVTMDLGQGGFLVFAQMDPELGSAIAFGAVVGLIAGAVCGLLPLIVGLTRKQVGLGVGGFVSCVIAGAVLGLLLAAPVAVIFTVIMFAVKRSPTPTA